LLAGPIERPHSLIPQIENKRKVESKDWEHGLWLFFWGVFKKVYIADNLSPFVDSAMSKGTGLEAGMISWIAVCFAFQVYADFSGYTDAARGMAKMMGFRLMLNFNLPFFSTSVAEFWKRWHISLSSWLRDYLYIPLGGNKIGLLRQNTNIIIVWTLGGLWHGATYGYLVWGIYCGVCIVVYNLLNKFFRLTQIQSNLLSFIGWVLSFWSFALGLLLFRVDGYSDLLRMIDLSFGIYWNWIWFGKLVLFLFPVIVVDSIQYLRSENESFLWVQDGWATRYRHLTYPIVLSFGFILFVGFGVFEQKEFFYFQF
jgi:D-alanyl-lipoteichoic acid acyltransferase DltB (MBOAT superfamily)